MTTPLGGSGPWYRAADGEGWTSQIAYAKLPVRPAAPPIGGGPIPKDTPMATDTVQWQNPDGTLEVHAKGCPAEVLLGDDVPVDVFPYESRIAVAHAWYVEEINDGVLTTAQALDRITFHPCTVPAIVPHPLPPVTAAPRTARKRGSRTSADAPARVAVGDTITPACACGETDERKYPTTKGGARDLRRCRTCRKAGR